MKTPYDVVIRPIISERSMDDAPLKKYTFEVATDANKTEVKHAIEEIFDVDVDKVNVISVKGKKKRMGRYEGFTAAKKKAIITLKPGSKEIEFFSGL